MLSRKMSDVDRVVAAQGISAIGDRIYPVALTFGVLSGGGSPRTLGLVLALDSLALLALILPGGRAADQLRRSQLMVRADLTRLISASALAALLLGADPPTWVFLPFALVHGAAAAFFYPAASGLIPRVCEPSDLHLANVRLALWRDASYLAGPALGALAVGVAGPGVGLLLDGLTFGVSAWLVAAVHEPASAGRSTMRSGQPGTWSYVVSQRWLVTGIAGFVVFLAVGISAWQVAGPIVARDHFGGVWGWSLLAGAGGAGSILGSLALARTRAVVALRPALVVLFTVWAAQLAALASGLPLVAVAAAALCGGATLTGATIAWNTRVQRDVPDALLGRVSSIDWFGSLAVQPLGYGLAGVSVASYGTKGTSLGAAIMLGTAAVAAGLSATHHRYKVLD